MNNYMKLEIPSKTTMKLLPERQLGRLQLRLI